MNDEIFKFQCRCFNFFNILKFTIGNLDEVIEVVSGNEFIYLCIYLFIYLFIYLLIYLFCFYFQVRP